MENNYSSQIRRRPFHTAPPPPLFCGTQPQQETGQANNETEDDLYVAGLAKRIAYSMLDSEDPDPGGQSGNPRFFTSMRLDNGRLKYDRQGSYHHSHHYDYSWVWTRLNQNQSQNQGRFYGGSRKLPSRSQHRSQSQWSTEGRVNGMGMRAIFLEENGWGSQPCSGTGVFLPSRCYEEANPDRRGKTPCSSVLLPSKVVEALNLKPLHTTYLTKMAPPMEKRATSTANDDHPMTNLNEKSGDNQYISLPAEWTY